MCHSGMLLCPLVEFHTWYETLLPVLHLPRSFITFTLSAIQECSPIICILVFHSHVPLLLLEKYSQKSACLTLGGVLVFILVSWYYMPNMHCFHDTCITLIWPFKVIVSQIWYHCCILCTCQWLWCHHGFLYMINSNYVPNLWRQQCQGRMPRSLGGTY